MSYLTVNGFKFCQAGKEDSSGLILWRCVKSQCHAKFFTNRFQEEVAHSENSFVHNHLLSRTRMVKSLVFEEVRKFVGRRGHESLNDAHVREHALKYLDQAFGSTLNQTELRSVRSAILKYAHVYKAQLRRTPKTEATSGEAKGKNKSSSESTQDWNSRENSLSHEDIEVILDDSDDSESCTSETGESGGTAAAGGSLPAGPEPVLLLQDPGSESGGGGGRLYSPDPSGGGGGPPPTAASLLLDSLPPWSYPTAASQPALGTLSYRDDLLAMQYPGGGGGQLSGMSLFSGEESLSLPMTEPHHHHELQQHHHAASAQLFCYPPTHQQVYTSLPSPPSSSVRQIDYPGNPSPGQPPQVSTGDEVSSTSYLLQDGDEDEKFFRNLLPMFKKLDYKDKLILKAQFHQLVNWKLKSEI